ncbi:MULTISPECIES: lasso peptide biosynthesis PqqD family chaperone [unclassified Saccharopolyspora]|uniref:lasso peptide biosynthesis PqqD family chaperone n=1 Tax=unclassified Saccharopolyspora TaxID=2646250 RepID=UPI001CD70ACE|nr:MULTISPECIES: lasso peptide biosynthesis PqqD family chaperone [unclassified Saccharopolyspora]MCA1188303.1 lasso peptide biosynthesis PqqD family chaperone [Saccharopolyspora sp. 6T]MCA1193487.1 lasso peptide biosynthesis PqqD family chaperone [Saccharopolyspora sp. 6V]MCA1229493.1 lasso peptide biosynthesis PqqD family chaperone [Saccharopolyspora sp. 6M]MCA1280518.1 lasso peptide biosynthesis PqqD family chaperone [Saccharopolyspora sp. 7B]
MGVRLHHEVSLAGTDEGSVLLDQRSGEYWQLNGSAATALRMLLDGAGEHEVAAALVADSPPGDVGLDEALRDVRELTEQLAAARLAVRS